MSHIFEFRRGDGTKGQAKVMRRSRGGVYLEIDRSLDSDPAEPDSALDRDAGPIMIMLGPELAAPIARAILEESE